MRLHRRNGKIYAFQAVKREGRVTTRYLGRGLVALLAMDVHRFVRDRRQKIQNDHKIARQRLQTLDSASQQLRAATRALYCGVLYASGCHLNRRQWRRRRGVQEA